MNTLLKYSLDTISMLEKVEAKDFAALYVKRRAEVFVLFGNGFITSTAHGIDFFNNVIKYIENPNEYRETVNGKSEYESNFREILKLNQ